ncbi:MAG: cytidine/deoxycytidylate deaminase family protein [Deltaproteobacteria bacterium]|nr:cytidine/deoxycytidylate deaminase family protein [Deltaproteobacteria bacterium]
MIEERISWDEYFLSFAQLAATRSTCLRRKVGAVIVKDKHIISTGYNGAPKGIRHCSEVGCIREAEKVPSGQRHELCRGLHAEQNAIIQAALYGAQTDGGIIYCTNQPCVICAKMIINAGIRSVVFSEGYTDSLAQEMLTEANIKLIKFDRK